MTYGTNLRRSRHGTLYFRYVIPSDARAIFGKSEVSISLGTASRRSAELLALELRLIAKRLIETARKRWTKTTSGSPTCVHCTH